MQHTEHVKTKPKQNRMLSYTAVLRMAGLRPTKQRLSLAGLLYRNAHRHVSAEQLHEEAQIEGISVSLATVYNTLRQFKHAGMLREITVDASRSYFDTDTPDHHHFFVEDDEQIMDVPSDDMTISNLPAAPNGMEIAHVDVVIRVKKNRK